MSRQSPPAPSREAVLRVPRWIYRRRNLLAGLPLAYAACSFVRETEDDALVSPLGLLLIAAGVAVRVWAQSHIRFRLGVGRHLTTTGPYAIVRNPLYIANTMICLGAVVLSELLWMLPLALFWCAVVYSLVARYEESRLLGKYAGSYRAYFEAVPRWVPRRLSLAGLGVAARYLRAAVLTEAPCLLIILPFLAKELLCAWFEQ